MSRDASFDIALENDIGDERSADKNYNIRIFPGKKNTQTGTDRKS